MPVTLLDLIVIGVMLISAILAMVRGFTREILSIAAWVAAAAAALLLHPYVLPFIAPYIKNPTVAQLVAGAAVFIVTLIVVSFITIRISDMILDSRIGAVDRSLGFIFGAARGLLLAVVAFIFFSWLVPVEKQPVWAQEAKSRVFLKQGGDWLLSMMPADPENALLKRLHPDSLPTDAPADTDPDANGASGTPPAGNGPAIDAPATPTPTPTPPATPKPQPQPN